MNNNYNISYRNAKGFQETAYNVFKLCDKPNFLDQLLAPCVVNYAFACELYLKTMLLKNGTTFKRTHKLKDLYILLDDISKENIENKYALDPRGKNRNFHTALELNTSVFEKFRYLHEVTSSTKSVEINALVKFCSILQIVCESNIKEDNKS